MALSLVATLFLLGLGVASAQAFPPDAKTEQGDDIRTLFIVVFVVAAVIFIAMEAAIIYIVMRYRRRSDALPPQIHGSRIAEVIWTAIPAVIVVVLFVISLIVLDDVESAPDDGEPVEVVDVLGRQWTWAFTYSAPIDATTASSLSRDPEQTTLEVSDGTVFSQLPPGGRTIRIDVEHLRVAEVNGNTLTVERAVDGTVAQNHASGAAIVRLFNGTEFIEEDRGDLSIIETDGEETRRRTPVVTVPVGKTVRFNLASVDVIHSFYTPQFLYKLDANPGRVQSLWLKVPEAGLYQGQCAEFCGNDHARMLFSVNALPLAEYEEWLAAKTPALIDASTAADQSAQAQQAAEREAGDGAAQGVGDAARGQELFFANGCNVCHGDNGEGGIGPTIASTGLSLDGVTGQYRRPRGVMPSFDEDRVPDADVADIYAWLQTLPLPDSIVPGEGTPK
ncbi:MAG: cytochrome c oxidase subunit II transmembrane domain-containing protein [Dehalococcoidia bacterium]